MKKIYTLTICFFLVNICFAQVGIGTNSPTNTLHVAGTIRVENTASTKVNSKTLTGLDNNGVVNEVVVGDNLKLTDGTLNVILGSTVMKIAYINDNFNAGNNDNYDLDLAGVNSDKTLFVLSDNIGNAGQSRFTGFSGGTDGRVIMITSYIQNFNIELIDTDPGSTVGNQIEFRAGSNGSTNVGAYGTFTLVYMAADQKWHVISKMATP